MTKHVFYIFYILYFHIVHLFDELISYENELRLRETPFIEIAI